LITLRSGFGDHIDTGGQKISGALWLGLFLLFAVDLDLPMVPSDVEHEN
jgi:hypothetical protein